jgi:hypothetical protein
VFGVFGRGTRLLLVVTSVAFVAGALAFVAFGRAVGFGDLGLGAHAALLGGVVAGVGGAVRA